MIRNDEAVTGVEKTKLRSTFVLLEMSVTGMVVHVVPTRYWMPNLASGRLSSIPMKTCALPISTGNGKSILALLKAQF